jgi:hypothetical protein
VRATGKSAQAVSGLPDWIARFAVPIKHFTAIRTPYAVAVICSDVRSRQSANDRVAVLAGGIVRLPTNPPDTIRDVYIL